MPAIGIYPSRVRFEIADGDLESYRRAADFLNVNQVDVLSVQHEWGFRRQGRRPRAVARTPDADRDDAAPCSPPSAAQGAVIAELARLSERLVVMSTSGRDLLTRGRFVGRTDRPHSPCSARPD